jgi:hypothetical protein
MLPSSVDDLKILKEEAHFYRLPELESLVRSAVTSASSASASPRPTTTNGPISAAAANGLVDDTTDIWNKASRWQLEFQSVYVAISSANGVLFTEEERANALAEVNERTNALQLAGFRVKTMFSGVVPDRQTKDYCMCASHPLGSISLVIPEGYSCMECTIGHRPLFVALPLSCSRGI